MPHSPMVIGVVCLTHLHAVLLVQLVVEAVKLLCLTHLHAVLLVQLVVGVVLDPEASVQQIVADAVVANVDEASALSRPRQVPLLQGAGDAQVQAPLAELCDKQRMRLTSQQHSVTATVVLWFLLF